MGRTVEDSRSFRTAMPVAKIILYRSGDAYPLCPRCGAAMEREYQNYCDRCGQRLGWKGFSHAQVVSK